MRQRRSTSHSPTRYWDTSHFGLETVVPRRDSKSVADTVIPRSSSPVGFLVALTNPWTSSEKYEANGCDGLSVMNVKLFGRRSLKDVIVRRFTAGRTGNLVQTSLWQSISVLCWVWFVPFLDAFLLPFSWNTTSVVFLVMSMAIEFTQCASISSARRETHPRLTIDVTTAPSSGKVGSGKDIPSVEPNVSQ